MTENELKLRMMRILRHQDIEIQPIETGGTGVGVSDWYYRTPRMSGWIEFKIGHERKDGSIKLKWEAGQLNWIRRFARMGDKMLLCVGVMVGEAEAFCLIEPDKMGGEYQSVTAMFALSVGASYLNMRVCDPRAIFKLLDEAPGNITKHEPH